MVRAASRRTRSGFGLTHTVLLMVVLGLLMGLAATVLGKAFLTYRQTLNHFQQFQTLQLAQSQFRSDAHNAIDAQVQEQTLVLTTANQRRVEYRSESGAFVRRLFQAEKQLGKQIWQLPASATASWTVNRSGTIPLVEANIEFDIVDSETPEPDNQPDTSKTPKFNAMKMGSIQWSSRVGVFGDLPSVQPNRSDTQEGSP